MGKLNTNAKASAKKKPAPKKAASDKPKAQKKED